MKEITLIVFLAAGCAAAAAGGPAWARVYYESVDAMNRDVLAAGMDVVSGAAGEYVDVIATHEELAALQEKGYRIEILAADAFAAYDLLPPDLGLYHTYAEMVAELQGYESTYPNLCKLIDIGDTWENREMWCLKVSDNPNLNEPNEVKLFVCGNHHARELMTVEIPLYYIKKLLEGYQSNPDYKYYVDNYEIYFVPMVNPDGHVYVENHSEGNPNNWWRKNRRDNGNNVYGVDLNRNYSYKWGYDNIGSSPTPSSQTYRGPAPFSEPETTAIRNLMCAVPFKFALDYHSYGEYILIPWGYPPASQSHTPEHSYFTSVAQGMNSKLNNRYRIGTPPEVLYQVNGGSIDYHYGEVTEKNKIYGWCFEVNTSAEGGFCPPESLIEPTCAEHFGVFLWFLNYMREYVGVTLTRFDAAARDGQVVITWETGAESTLAGFNLYRGEATSGDGAPVRVNRELIKGQSPYRFVDSGVRAAGIYEYTLEAVDLGGQRERFGPVRVEMKTTSPNAFTLYQNVPNPARCETTIKFATPSAGDATVTIYDLAGRQVRRMGVAAKAGENAVRLNVSGMAPGVYTYRVDVGGASATRKMVVIE